MRTDILVPVLGRPQNVVPLVESIKAATPEPHSIMFIASAGDTDEIAALEAACQDYLVIDEPGTYARKINLAARETSSPLMFSAADDLLFHKGWLSEARWQLKDGVQVVGTNDLGNQRTINGDHSTHTLFTRAYINDPGGVIDGPPGQVLCEQYPHDYCDDEFIQTAKARGVYAHAFGSHVEHMHWLWGKGDPAKDDTYRLGESTSPQGGRIFAHRRRLWRRLERRR